jgi:hypothetical protein
LRNKADHPSRLRIRIWRLIDNFTPHEIRITVTTPSKDADIKKRPTFKLHTPLPTALHVSHESRTQVLKTYKTIFKVKDRSGIDREEVYFNPALDSIFVSIPRCTREWMIYTGGHIHLPKNGIKTPFDAQKHNILRCQVLNSDPQALYQTHDAETIVVIQPTKTPLEVQSNERTKHRFLSLARVAGEQWKSVEYFVWKPEWWAEHWEFLFEELVKEEPEAKKRKYKGKGTRHRKIGGSQKGW